MPRLTLEEKILKVQEEVAERISKKAEELKEELKLYVDNFKSDEQLMGYINNIIKAIDGEE